MSLEYVLKNSPISGDLPFASQLGNGEIALNYHSDGCFLTCVDTDGKVRRLNEVWVNRNPPLNPEKGLLWCDISGTSPLLKIWLGLAIQWFVIGSGVGPGPGGGVQSIAVVPDGGVKLSGTVENPVLSVDDTVLRTSGDQSIVGTKTFLNPIKGNLNGRADTSGVAEGVNQRIAPGTGLTGGGVLTSQVTLAVRPATNASLGGIRVGTGLSVTSDGLLSASVTPGNIYLGSINVVSEDVPTEPNPKPNGSYYINKGVGLAKPSWDGIANTQVYDGNYIIFNSNLNRWENAGTVIGGGVEEIIAGDGIGVLNPKSAAPTVSVDGTVVRTARTLLAGTGLSGGGTLDKDVTFALAKATATSLGGIQVGAGLAINDGILSADISSLLIYQGLTQVDKNPAPQSPERGWCYVNEKFAVAGPSWVGIAGQDIPDLYLITYDGTQWQAAGSINTLGVTSILAGPGITVLNGSTGSPTVQVNDQVVLATNDSTIAGTKTFTKPIVGDITGRAVYAQNSDQSQLADKCNRKVFASDGLTGGGLLTNDVVLQCDETVVRTSGNQNIDGAKRFLQAIQGNLNGNADTATSARYAEETVEAKTVDITVNTTNGIQGGGKLVTDIELELDSTVLRDFGNQTIDGDKKFLRAIQGNLNGNADSATNAQFAQEAIIAKSLDLSVVVGEGLSGGGKLTEDVTIEVDATVVRTARDQVIDGNKRFLKAIQGNLNGNADTATNAEFAEQLNRTVSAVKGLIGGGLLNEDIEIGLPLTGVAEGTYKNATVTVDTYGRVTAASTTVIEPPFPVGTRMMFCQDAPPAGWVRETSPDFNDASIRVVTGSGGGTGGTIPFSSLFSGTTSYAAKIALANGSVGYTALSVSQMPPHQHDTSVTNSSLFPARANYTIQYGGAGGYPASTFVMYNTGGGEGHTHSLAGITADGQITTNFNLKYVNTIIATKS
jgi:hypothetical protein